ncbi:redoxin domain-containing protein [Chloroflexota bacterium]
MAEKQGPLKILGTAPDFTLRDQNSVELVLAELRGRRVLLSFHPLAWTSICAQQMQSLEANMEAFESLNTVPLGISVDSVPSKKAWAESLGVKGLRMLSDFWPHGRVAGLYGIFREKSGTSERVNVILDENGKISFFKVYEMGQLPDIDEIVEVLKGP